MVVDTYNYDVLFGLDFFDKNWCNHGCEAGLDPSKAWSKGQCGGITINYGKFTSKNEFINSDVGCYYYFGGHTYQW